MLKQCFTVLSLSLLSTQAWADNDRFNKNYRWEAPAVWQETARELPPFPNETTQWLTIDLGPSTWQAAIARESLVVGLDDGVVQFALKQTSPHGAENISVQSLRCATASFQIKAIARPSEKRWVESQNKTWRKINNAQAVQWTLARDYFCDFAAVLKEHEILRNFK